MPQSRLRGAACLNVRFSNLFTPIYVYLSAKMCAITSPVDKAVEQAHRALFFNMGQCCIAGSRTYVQEEIYDEFVKKSIARAMKRRVGDPFVLNCESGPQVSILQSSTYLSLCICTATKHEEVVQRIL